MAIAAAIGIGATGAQAAPVAVAAAPPAETIITPYVNNAPWWGSSNPGTWSASGPITDHGTIPPFAFHLSAAMNPTSAAESVHGFRTLSGEFATIVLHCNEAGHTFANADPSAIPITGNCTVTGGTLAYAGLSGQGKLTGTVDLTGPTTAYFNNEVLQLTTR